MPPATRDAQAAELGAGAGGRSGRQPPDTIDGSSSNDSRTNRDSSKSSDSGDRSALVGRPVRDLEAFGALPALYSGRTRTQSRGLTMSASCADALLTYAMRTVEAKSTVEAKRTVEVEPAEIERAHNSLLKERLEKEHE